MFIYLLRDIAIGAVFDREFLSFKNERIHTSNAIPPTKAQVN
jgi:hypothetical protein